MWEYQAIQLSASTLCRDDETIGVHELAERLSNAIIETVHTQQAQNWELVKMDFNKGEVTIRFRRRQKRAKHPKEASEP